MLCRSRGDLALNAAQTFLNELLERPACAVTGQHGKIVDMHIAGAVCICDLLIIDLGEPVIRGDRTGIAEDQTADGIGHGRILLDAPVTDLDVLINGILVIKHRGFHVAELLALLAVKDVRLCDIAVAALCQHMLNAVLNILNSDHVVLDLVLKVGSHAQCKKINDRRMILSVLRIKCFPDRFCDFRDLEIDHFTVTFGNLIHE